MAPSRIYSGMSLLLLCFRAVCCFLDSVVTADAALLLGKLVSSHSLFVSRRCCNRSRICSKAVIVCVFLSRPSMIDACRFVAARGSRSWSWTSGKCRFPTRCACSWTALLKSWLVRLCVVFFFVSCFVWIAA